jgi:anti-sigma-K factor RskA
MPDHVVPHPDVASYVLDALDPREAAAFQQHLAGCDACRAEVADLQGLPVLLEQAASPAEVPPGLRERTFAAVERAAAGQHHRRRLRLAAVAAVLLVALLGGMLVSRSGPFGDRTEVVAVALAAPDGGPARATAKIRRVGGRLEIDLEVNRLAANPPGTVYECWLVGPADTLARPNRVSAGTFTVGTDGRASLRLTSAADLRRYPVMGVTLEADGGNPARTGSKQLVSQPITG